MTICSVFNRFFGTGLVVCVTSGVLTTQLISASLAGQGTQQSGDIADSLQKSSQHAQSKQEYDLRYKLREGEVIRWDAEQIASTDVGMAGHKEQSSLRSRSTIAWKVISIDSRGNMTFEDVLESAREWQKVGEEEPQSFDSTKDDDVPDLFLSTSEKIGKPISTITIDPKGQVVNRIEHMKSAELGMGKVTFPLPAVPIKIGSQWNTPELLTARRSDNSLKKIKTRMLYTLRDVKDGLATITFRREVLTPIEEPKVKSQIQQKLNQGTILFDIPNGRVTKQFVQWDEKVQGFEGADSFLHYLGSYTKTIRSGAQQAIEMNSPGSSTIEATPASTGKTGDETSTNRSSRIIKPRDGKPTIRK